MPDSMAENMAHSLETQARTQDQAEAALPMGLRELGSTGLKRAGGVIAEEYLLDLQGTRGIRVFTEMSSNDPIASSMVFSLSQLLSRLPWEISPPESANVGEIQATEFIRSAFEDMESPWANVLEDAMTEIPYGWAFMETNYKIRLGPDAAEDWRRSKFTDGRVGWKSFRIRAQDTLVQWIYDEKGNLLGMQQLDPAGGGIRTIPLAKALLFRTTSQKDNPEGRSLLRGAYRPWYFKKRLEEYEGIGVERDLAGLPVVYMDQAYFGTDPTLAAMRQRMEQAVSDVRNDSAAGLVIPLARDDKGNKLIEFELMASPGQKAFDTNEIIKRKSQEMAMSILMDFLMLGHEGVGSFALGTAKIDLWTTAIDAVAKGIAATFNEYAIKPLLRIARMKPDRLPTLTYGDVANEDLESLGQFIEKMVDAGVLTPGPDLEAYVRNAAGLPVQEEAPYGVAPPTQ